MKVYIVSQHQGSYSDYSMNIEKIFDSLAKAEAFKQLRDEQVARAARVLSMKYDAGRKFSEENPNPCMPERFIYENTVRANIAVRDGFATPSQLEYLKALAAWHKTLDKNNKDREAYENSIILDADFLSDEEKDQFTNPKHPQHEEFLYRTDAEFRIEEMEVE
jgi:hypothetical protein